MISFVKGFHASWRQHFRHITQPSSSSFVFFPFFFNAWNHHGTVSSFPSSKIRHSAESICRLNQLKKSAVSHSCSPIQKFAFISEELLMPSACCSDTVPDDDMTNVSLANTDAVRSPAKARSPPGREHRHLLISHLSLILIEVRSRSSDRRPASPSRTLSPTHTHTTPSLPVSL